jgi:hypothetical protein
LNSPDEVAVLATDISLVFQMMRSLYGRVSSQASVSAHSSDLCLAIVCS